MNCSLSYISRFLPHTELKILSRLFTAGLLILVSEAATLQAQIVIGPPLPPAHSGLTAVWANNGEDKVTQDELRATGNALSVMNNSWNGKSVTIFGAQNEVVGFNVILESALRNVNNVTVDFETLTGPAGATISSPPLDPSAIFDWTNRNIELFYVRYLQVKGLSYLNYNSGYQGIDERIVPSRLQRPWTGNGVATGLWTDRPSHDKFFPDIAVPLELSPTFSISKGTNQSIWVDVYIPKGTTPGLYQGTVRVLEGGRNTRSIPVELTVRGFTLPDAPSSKTMLYFSQINISKRLFGITFLDPGSTLYPTLQLDIDRLFQIAHRHKISLIGDQGITTSGDQPSPEFIDRLNGNLFTRARGYNGPGVGLGNDVYSIWTYGGWMTGWTSIYGTLPTEDDVWNHSNNWETWFSANVPGLEHFLYLCDECEGNGRPTAAQVNTWAGWLKANPGPGKTMKSFATVPFDVAAASEPLVDYPADTAIGNPTVFANAVTEILDNPGSELYVYNPARPAAGSFALEDDGVSLREAAWAQYRKNVHRLFYWESTYYTDDQSPNSSGHGIDNDLFHNPVTFGGSPTTVFNTVKGQVSSPADWQSNSEGVLFYPGSDVIYPNDSYGVLGVFASLRLKHWRRGIQDVDYIALANAVDPVATQAIVATMVPQAFWDFTNLGGYVISNISYSINPDDWENARLKLAHIVDGQ